jgi:hypothetical protein
MTHEHEHRPHHGEGHHHHPHHGHHHLTLIINGKEKPWSEEQINYDQLVQLSGEPLPAGPDPGFTVTYFNGPRDTPEGALTEGHSVKVKTDMVFNVTPTNRS